MIALFQFGDYTVCMYSKIIQRRHRGVERSDRDIANDPGVFGEVTMYRVGGHKRMQVREWGNQTMEALLLPSLWCAECLAVGPTCEEWRGFQQAQLPEKKGMPTYLQEWRIEFIGMQPPDESLKSIFQTYNVPVQAELAPAVDQVPPVP
jgi:hypothetical protein